MKKKILSSFLALAMAGTTVVSVFANNEKLGNTASLNVNGKCVNTDVEIVDDRSMLPVRDLLEAIGYTVDWNGETKTVTAESDITLENNGELANAKPIYGLGNYFTSENFTGEVYLNNIAENGGVSIANVTFDKGCINSWHIHDHVQILMGTMGEGYAQMEGQDPQLIKVGDVVVIPAGTKHWHGATKNSQFTHISVSGPVEGGMEEFGTKWLESVNQEDYDKLNN